MELRKGGASSDQIARLLEYPDEAAVAEGVSRALDTHSQSLEEIRKLEIERLDAMMRGLWPTAVQGNHLKVDRCLQIMERRAQLLGLDRLQPPLEEVEDTIDEIRARRDARRST